MEMVVTCDWKDSEPRVRGLQERKRPAPSIHLPGRPGRVETGRLLGLSETRSSWGPRPALGLQLGCSVGHGTLSPASEPLIQSSEALKC